MTTGERFVLVTVRIRTWGRSCNNEFEDDGCGYLRTDDETSHGDRCDLFEVDVGRDPTMDIGLFVRCPSCLVLDEPNAPGAAERERTPEEAMAHGFGAQNG